jgi:hypothetical protein
MLGPFFSQYKLCLLLLEEVQVMLGYSLLFTVTASSIALREASPKIPTPIT